MVKTNTMIIPIVATCFFIRSSYAQNVEVNEAVVNFSSNVFSSLDKNVDGILEPNEVRQFVEKMGGPNLDEESEIVSGVASVMKNLDVDHDHQLSKSDFVAYWSKLGSLLTIDEVALWVEHAVQLPTEAAEILKSHGVTGFNFPDLLQQPTNGKDPLETDFGIQRKNWRKHLRRGIQYLLGVSTMPLAPTNMTWQSHGPHSVTIEWAHTDEGAIPVHKFLLRRQDQNQPAPKIVYDGLQPKFTDDDLEPESTYTYTLQSWNVVGHSPSVTIEATTRKEEAYRFSGVLGTTVGMVAFLVLVGTAGFYLKGAKPNATQQEYEDAAGCLQGNEQVKTTPKRCLKKAGEGYLQNFTPDFRRSKKEGEFQSCPLIPSRENEEFTGIVKSVSQKILSGQEKTTPAGLRRRGYFGNRSMSANNATIKNESMHKLDEESEVNVSSVQVKQDWRNGLKNAHSQDSTPIPEDASSHANGILARRKLYSGSRSSSVNSAQTDDSEDQKLQNIDEMDDMSSCGICQKKFKYFKRYRHHCSKCSRVFCQKHGFIAHHNLLDCGIPGKCVCNRCLEQGSRSQSGSMSQR